MIEPIKRWLKNCAWTRRLAIKFLGIPKTRSHLLNMIPKHSVGAEIGVHKGEFSRYLLDIAKPTELHLIDPWQYYSSAKYKDAWYGGEAKGGQDEMNKRYDQVCKKLAKDVKKHRVVIHRAISEEVLVQFDDDYFDWVYVDGNHSYEYVLKDITLSLKKTKPGGLIMGDDYTETGWWGDDVKRAVGDVLAQQNNVEQVEIKNGQFILRKLS